MELTIIMDIVFAGTPEIAAIALREILADDYFSVVGVLTQPDTKKGRGSDQGRQKFSSKVAQLARENGIEVYQPEDLRHNDAVRVLERWQPQCCAVVAYGKLIPESLLSRPLYGWVNLHFSLLPLWRGASPVQSAIAAGDEITGATTFLLEKGLDSGPILGTITEKIQSNDTAGILLDRLSYSGSKLLISTLKLLDNGDIHPVPQSAENISYAAKISTESAKIRWDLPAYIIERHIRSVTPYPGAWSMWNTCRVKLAPVELTNIVSNSDPGTVVCTPAGILVNTGSMQIRLTHIQPAGKKFMSSIDWARGLRSSDNICFGG